MYNQACTHFKHVKIDNKSNVNTMKFDFCID